METKKEIKLQIAKDNREMIIESIKRILSSKNTSMTLKEAMDVFLSVNVKDLKNEKIFIYTGLQKVEKESSRKVKKVTSREYYSDSPEIFRQLPSSMR